jgi:hypothetical protein
MRRQQSVSDCVAPNFSPVRCIEGIDILIVTPYVNVSVDNGVTVYHRYTQGILMLQQNCFGNR